MTMLSRAGSLLILILCTAAPVRAQEPAQTPAAPRCVRASMAADDSGLVRYNCAGTGEWRRVAYSVSLPADWTIEETADPRRIALLARQGVPSIMVQAGDELFAPMTSEDWPVFWLVAAELLLGRRPTANEMEALRRNAGDEAGARLMLTHAQSTDSALIALASALASARQDIEVVTRTNGIGTLVGQRAGHLMQRIRQDGQVIRREGYITVRNGIYFGILVLSSDAEWATHRDLWERVFASFTIHSGAR